MGSTRVSPADLIISSESLNPPEGEFNELQLTETLLQIAKKELREDKCSREQCLQQLRIWMSKNDDIQDTRSDDLFLLRFLRVKKFSVPMAQQVLLKYMNLRKTFPHMTHDLDFLGTRINEIISAGYIFTSPIRDKFGRRVVIINARHFNPKIYSSEEQAKAHFITYETLMEEHENQILGLTHVGDFSGVTAGHVTNWNPTEFARVFKWGEQSLPMRHKEIHLVNVPASLKWLIDFVKTRVSPKIKNRLNCYVSEKDLPKHMDVDCLPLELGGKIPMIEMIESWKIELAKKRDSLLRLDEMKLLSDQGITSSRNPDKTNQNGTNFVAHFESLSGSFRKLEID